MKGLLNIDKPGGFSSAAVVSKARKALGFKKIGHMGTLDPMGTGVLVLGVGKAARLFDYFLGKDKVYEAEFCFGFETDSLDVTGNVTGTTAVLPSKQTILDALPSLIGKLDQLPPKVSAKSINGVRAYDLFRSGKEFELKSAPVTVYSLELLSETGVNTYLFRIHCSSGTYIRSIARDLGYKTGSLATMKSIRRTRSGLFTVDEAVTIDALEREKENALISLDDALKNLKRLDIDDGLYDKLSNGVKLSTDVGDTDEYIRVYCRQELFGLYKIENNLIINKIYLKD